MPMNEKGRKIMANMKKEYGDKAKQVFYASKNKGTITGVEGKDNKKKIAMAMRATKSKS